MLLFNLLGTTHATSLVLGTSMCDDLACASKHTGLKVLASLILISCVGSREASKTCRAVYLEDQVRNHWFKSTKIFPCTGNIVEQYRPLPRMLLHTAGQSAQSKWLIP